MGKGKGPAGHESESQGLLSNQERHNGTGEIPEKTARKKKPNKEIMCFSLLPLASHRMSPLQTAFHLPLLDVPTMVP